MQKEILSFSKMHVEGDQVITATHDELLMKDGRVLDLKYKEIEYNQPIFDMPYVNSIIKEHNLYRVRLMNLKPKRCYTYHYDLTKRFHIPIETNDKCFFIVDKKVVQFPADGNYYILDTTKNHTAIYASKEDRIHLIGNFK